MGDSLKDTNEKLQIESDNKMAAESLVSQLQYEIKSKVNKQTTYIIIFICASSYAYSQSDNIAELELTKNTLQSNLDTANMTISSQNEVE